MEFEATRVVQERWRPTIACPAYNNIGNAKTKVLYLQYYNWLLVIIEPIRTLITASSNVSITVRLLKAGPPRQ